MAPLHVIGGYLGSGKTTLVNRLLERADGRRVAVLVNDFGDVDVDVALIRSADDDIISLANGCICCSLADGVVEAFATLRERAGSVDVVVVEASGVADPATISRLARAARFDEGRTIVVVDAETVRRRASDRFVGDTVLRQLRVADVCVVNKTDLAGRHELDRLLPWLADRAPHAELVETVRCAIGWESFDGEHTDHAGHAGFRHAGAHHSWILDYDRPVDRATLEADVEALPDDIVRVKGVVALADDTDRAWSVQRVGDRVELERLHTPPPERSRVVVIAAGPG